MKKRKIAKAALAVLSMLTIGAAGASFAACGGDDDNEHTHEYGSWTLITEPKLDADGKAERYCKDNDDGKETVNVPKLTDTSVWTEDLTAKVDATHVADGKREFTSEDYGTVTVTIPAKTADHSYGDWTLTTDPTDETVGVAERTCTKDGANHKDVKDDVPVLSDPVWKLDTTKGESATHIKDGKMVFTSVYGEVTVDVPAKVDDHAYGDWEFVGTKPTLNDGGKIRQVCNKDGADHKIEEDVTALLTDDWEMTVKSPATHQNAGEADFKHKVYGVEVKGVTLPKIDHDFGAWVMTTKPTKEDKGVATRVCADIEGDCAEDETATETFKIPNLDDTTFWTKTTTPANYNSGTTDTYTDKEGYGFEVVEVADDKIAAPYDNEEYYCLEYYINDDGALIASTRDNLYGGAILSLDKNTGTGTTYPVFGEVTINSVNPDVLTGEIEVIVKSSNGKVDTYPAYYDDETHVIVMIFSTTSIKVLTPFSDPKSFDKTIYEEDEDGDQIVVGSETVDSTIAKKDAKAGSIVVNNDTIFAIDYNYDADKHLTIFVNEGVVTFNVEFSDLTHDNYDVSAMSENVNLFVTKDEETIVRYGYNVATKKWLVCDGFEGVYSTTPDMGAGLITGAGTLFYGEEFAQNTSYEIVSDTTENKTVGAILEIPVGDEQYIKVYYEFTVTGEDTVDAVAPEVTITLNMGEVEASDIVLEHINKKVPYALPVPEDDEKQFMGWFEDADFNTPVVLDKEGKYSPTEDVELHAKWAAKIVLKIEGAMDGDNATLHVGAGTVLSDYLPNYLAGSTIDRVKGLKFTGWFMGDDPVSEEAELPEGMPEITITAHWEACPAYEGTYNGVYISNSDDNRVFGGIAKQMSIGENGKIVMDGVVANNKTVFMNADKTFWVKESEDSETGNVYGVYDPASGIIIFADYTNNADLHTGNRTYIMFVDKAEVSFKQVKNYLGQNTDPDACYFDDGKARLMTLIIDGEETNVFMLDGVLYVGVDFTYDYAYGELTAKDMYTANGLKVCKDGELIANFVKYDDKRRLVRTDGYEGLYEGEESTVKVDGIGGITFKGHKGTYEVIDENVLGVYITIKDEEDDEDEGVKEYYEVTLNVAEGTFESDKTMVTVKYVDDDGDGSDEVSVNKNIAYTLPIPTHTDSVTYIFVGWYLDAELETPVPADWAPSAAETTLYAKYDEKKVLTIHGFVQGSETATTFYFGNGSFFNDDGTKVTEIKVTNPADLIYEFVGFYTDEDCTEGNEYDITSALTEDVEIYAKWYKYPEEFVGNYKGLLLDGSTAAGGQLKGSNDQNQQIDKRSNLSIYPSGKLTWVDKEAKTVVLTESDNTTTHLGYFYEDEGILIVDYMTNRTEMTHKVYLYFKDATGFNSGTSITIGSYWDSGKSKLFTVKPFGTEGEEFTIFMHNGKVYLNPKFESSDDSEVLTVSNLYNTAQHLVYFYAEGDTEKTTPIAIYKYANSSKGLLPYDGMDVINYVDGDGNRVKFDGTGVEVAFTYDEAEKKLPYKKAPAGATYDYVAEDSSSYFEITISDENVCTIVSPKITVHFNTNGGSEIPDKEFLVKASFNSKAAEYTPTRDRYVFAGWYMDETLTTSASYWVDVIKTDDGTMTLYAKWTPAYGITTHIGDTEDVLFLVQGTNVQIKQGTASSGYYLNYPTSLPAGKDFRGWYTDEDCTQMYTGGALNADVELWAKLVDSQAVIDYGTSSNAFTLTKEGNDYIWTNINKKTNAKNSTTTMTITANAAGMLMFDYNVNSETSDKLSIKKGSTTLVELGGTTNVYQSLSVVLAAGESVTIKYTKDNSTDTGEDAAYIKNIVFAAFDTTLEGNYTCAGQTDIHLDGGVTITRGEETGTYLPMSEENTFDVFFMTEGVKTSHYTLVIDRTNSTYTLTENKVTVSFNMHGTGDAISSVNSWNGIGLAVTTPTDSTGEKLFVGWYEDENFETPAVITDGIYVPTKNTELHAKWVLPHALRGEWKGANPCSTTNMGKDSKDLTSTQNVSDLGVCSSYATGTITDYDTETGSFTVVSGSSTYQGAADAANGVMYVEYYVKTQNKHYDIRFSVKLVEGSTKASMTYITWDGGNTKLALVTYKNASNETVATQVVLIYNGLIYGNVSWVAKDGSDAPITDFNNLTNANSITVTRGGNTWSFVKEGNNLVISEG